MRTRRASEEHLLTEAECMPQGQLPAVVEMERSD